MARVENETVPRLLDDRYGKEGFCTLSLTDINKTQGVSEGHNYTYSKSWILQITVGENFKVAS